MRSRPFEYSQRQVRELWVHTEQMAECNLSKRSTLGSNERLQKCLHLLVGHRMWSDINRDAAMYERASFPDPKGHSAARIGNPLSDSSVNSETAALRDAFYHSDARAAG